MRYLDLLGPVGTAGPPSSKSYPGLTLVETPVRRAPFTGADSKEVTGLSVGS